MVLRPSVRESLPFTSYLELEIVIARGWASSFTPEKDECTMYPGTLADCSQSWRKSSLTELLMAEPSSTEYCIIYPSLYDTSRQNKETSDDEASVRMFSELQEPSLWAGGECRLLTGKWPITFSHQVFSAEATRDN